MRYGVARIDNLRIDDPPVFVYPTTVPDIAAHAALADSPKDGAVDSRPPVEEREGQAERLGDSKPLRDPASKAARACARIASGTSAVLGRHHSYSVVAVEEV